MKKIFVDDVPWSGVDHQNDDLRDRSASDFFLPKIIIDKAHPSKNNLFVSASKQQNDSSGQLSSKSNKKLSFDFLLTPPKRTIMDKFGASTTAGKNNVKVRESC